MPADASALRAAYFWAFIPVLAALAWGWSLSGFLGGELAVGCCGAFSLVTAPVHEGGHLVAAIVCRLRVITVRVWGRTVFERSRGRTPTVTPGPALNQVKNFVLVDVLAARIFPGPRMVVISLGGPFANGVVAAAAFAIAFASGTSSAARCALVGAGVASAWPAAANLVPVATRSVPSDGLNVLRWLLRPAAQMQFFADSHRSKEFARQADTEEIPALRAAAMDPRASIAGNAAAALVRRISRTPSPDWRSLLESESPYILRALQTPGVAAARVVEIAAAVSHIWALQEHVESEMAASGRDVRGDAVVQIVAWAELAHRASPEDVRARIALAQGRLLQGRSVEARSLLVWLDTATTERNRALQSAVRCLVELDLGDVAQADRALSNCPEQARGEFLVRKAQHALSAAVAAH